MSAVFIIMERDSRSKKTATKKAPVKATSAEGDPFAAVVESNAVKKPAVVKKSAAAPKPEVKAKPVKTAVGKEPTVIVSDPFAEKAVTSSPVKKRAENPVKAKAKPINKVVKTLNFDATAELAASKPKVEVSPVFKALADVSLPELKRENRARLQMQTPTRLYFYWSAKENPWALLRSVFGDDLGSYTLVVKLIDTQSEREEINQCDAEGNWWFDVEPDHSYKAEIGFYAPNRPYFRVLYSNEIQTPRRTPSPRSATGADWKVTADKFAEVLDVAGFSRDAFDVAMAGDDQALAQSTSQVAFSDFLGTPDVGYEAISAEDIRYALLALASGVNLEDIRFRVSPALFAILQANAASGDRSKAMNALTEHFDIEETEFIEEQFGAAVYGASLVNFPRSLKTRATSARDLRRYNPISSHSSLSGRRH